jgi:two-component system response regulator DesR
VSDAPERLSILCVDDNVELVEALRLLLTRECDYEWAGALFRADELVEVARDRRPDVVLLDVDMPGRDPLEIVVEVAAACPEVRIVVLSGHVHRDLVSRAITAGAWGYVAKTEGERAILDGVRRVASGEFVMSPEVRTCYAL